MTDHVVTGPKAKKVSLTPPTPLTSSSRSTRLTSFFLPSAALPQPTSLRSGIPKLALPTKPKATSSPRSPARAPSTAHYSTTGSLGPAVVDTPSPHSPRSPYAASIAAPKKSPRSTSPRPSPAPSALPSYARPTSTATSHRIPTKSSIPQPRGILKKPVTSRPDIASPLPSRAAAITERLTSSSPLPSRGHSRHESVQSTHSRHQSGGANGDLTSKGHVKGKTSVSASAAPVAPAPVNPSSRSSSRRPSAGAEDPLAVLASAREAQAKAAEVHDDSASRPARRGHSRGVSRSGGSLGGDGLLTEDAVADIDIDMDLDTEYDQPQALHPTLPQAQAEAASTPVPVAFHAEPADEPLPAEVHHEPAAYAAPVKADREEEKEAEDTAPSAVSDADVSHNSRSASVIFIPAGSKSTSRQASGSLTPQDLPYPVSAPAETHQPEEVSAPEAGPQATAEEAEDDDDLDLFDDDAPLPLSDAPDAFPASVETAPVEAAQAEPIEVPTLLTASATAIDAPAPVPVVPTAVPAAHPRADAGEPEDGQGVDASFSAIVVDRDPMDSLLTHTPTPVTRTPNVTVSQSAPLHPTPTPPPTSLTLSALVDDLPSATRTPAVSVAPAVPFPLDQALTPVDLPLAVAYATSALERPAQTADAPTLSTEAETTAPASAPEPSPAPTTGAEPEPAAPAFTPTPPTTAAPSPAPVQAPASPAKQVAFAEEVTSVEAPHHLSMSVDESSDLHSDVDFGADDAFPKTPERGSVSSEAVEPTPVPAPATDSVSQLKALEAGRRAEEDRKVTAAALAAEAAAKREALEKAEDEKFEREKAVLAREKVAAQLEESKTALFQHFEDGVRAQKLGKKGAPRMTRVWVYKGGEGWVVGWDSKKKAPLDAQIPMADAKCVVGGEEGMFLHRRYAGKYEDVKARCVSVVSVVRGLDFVLEDEGEVNQWVAMMRLINVKVVENTA